MTQTHQLKSWPEFFAPILKGEKNFELRKNDRNFAVGDMLQLYEWEPSTGKRTGRELTKVVTYRLDGIGPGGIPPLHGLSRGYCILSLRDP